MVVAEVLKLLLTVPVEFRNYTESTNPNAGIPGMNFPGAEMGPGMIGPMGPGMIGPMGSMGPMTS